MVSEIREAREAVAMSQAELARRAGIAQPNLAAYESGARPMSKAMRARLFEAVRPFPHDLVERHRVPILEVIRANHASNPRLFGSVARRTDTRDSDLDIVVDMDPDATLYDMVAIGEGLEDLLGIHVDVVSSGGLTDAHGSIRADMVPL